MKSLRQVFTAVQRSPKKAKRFKTVRQQSDSDVDF